MKNYVAGGMAYERLAKACAQVGGIYNSRRHLEVNIEESEQGALRAWLSARVQEVEPDTWAETGQRLGRLGYWEFGDYRG